MKEKPLVMILILNWNNYPDTRSCLESLSALTYQNTLVVVVDNGSDDGSRWLIRENFPNIRIIELKKNLGFAGGNNAGLRYAVESGVPWVLLLNNDTVVLQEDFIGILIQETQADDSLAAIGPMVLTRDGNPQQTLLPYPTLGKILRNTLGLYKPDLEKKQYVDSIAGCCVLIKLAAIQQAGLLDENYFMYAEETEWFYRMRRLGWKVMYLPIKSILHKGESSSRRFESRTMYVERRANVIYTLVKHGQTVQAALTALLMAALLLARILGGPFGKREDKYPAGVLPDLIKAFCWKWKLARDQHYR